MPRELLAALRQVIALLKQEEKTLPPERWARQHSVALTLRQCESLEAAYRLDAAPGAPELPELRESEEPRDKFDCATCGPDVTVDETARCQDCGAMATERKAQ